MERDAYLSDVDSVCLARRHFQNGLQFALIKLPVPGPFFVHKKGMQAKQDCSEVLPTALASYVRVAEANPRAAL